MDKFDREIISRIYREWRQEVKRKRRDGGLLLIYIYNIININIYIINIILILIILIINIINNLTCKSSDIFVIENFLSVSASIDYFIYINTLYNDQCFLIIFCHRFDSCLNSFYIKKKKYPISFKICNPFQKFKRLRFFFLFKLFYGRKNKYVK